MLPELFTLPFLNISIKSYGLMMVIGFLAAVTLARWRSGKLGENPEHITNFALWALILGVIGARVFYVIHHWSLFSDDPLSAFKVWNGGLEFLGGFILAVLVLIVYFKIKKRSVFRFMDILAPSLALGLAVGRLGCFLNGCCFGAQCELPWAIEFPAVNEMNASSFGEEKQVAYRYSPPYESQLYPNLERNSLARPSLILPDDYIEYFDNGKGHKVFSRSRIPPDDQEAYYPVAKLPYDLTETQIEKLKAGQLAMHPIHPTQLYSFFNGLWICLFLNWMFKRRKFEGQISALLLILYGATRIVLESLRADNPIEFTGLTISQNLGILAVILGIVLYYILRAGNSKTAA
jgi:phosphatidylglycerol:prolipoprotein diacylglycerol transferase